MKRARIGKVWTLLGVIVGLSLTGCSGKKTAAPDASAGGPVASESEAAATGGGSSEAESGAGEEGSEARPLRAEDLQPKVQVVGSPGMPPDRIEVLFALPIVSGERLANAQETRLAIRPKISGTLRFTSPSKLVFEPTLPFTPATTYEVMLQSVETRSGPVTPPRPNPWVMRFSTPPFGLDRAMVDHVEYGRRRVTLRLFFTGPVRAADLQRALKVRSGGAAVGVTVQAARGPWFSRSGGSARSAVFDVRAEGAFVRPGGKLTLTLRAGLPMATDRSVTAKAASREIVLYGGKPVVIRAVGVVEGTNGYYLEVVCNDEAVEQTRYFWSRELERSFGELSARCLPDEDEALERIHIEPATKSSIAPGSGGFRIFGDFQRGAVTLRIEAGLRTRDGGLLQQDFEQTLTIPARSPALRFVSKGRYLPRSAWKRLPISHRNLEKATVTVRVVPERNLIYWMADSNERVGPREGDVVARRTLSLASKPDETETTWIDVSDLVPQGTRGLLELTLSAPGVQDSARLVLTDLHLVAKRVGADEAHPWGKSVTVWAMGAGDGRLRSGVQVDLVLPSGKVLGTCTTAGEAGCRIDLPEKGIDESAPVGLVAHHGDDLTYLKFAELKLAIEDAPVQGEPYTSGQAYRAFVYTERGVYRPGEEAHLVALVRRASGPAPKAKMPIRLRVIDPRGKTIVRRRLRTDAVGMVSTELRLAPFATTGHYRIEVRAAKHLLGSATFQVEEFVPERMKVEVQAPAGDVARGEPIAVSVGARYLFGGVPAGQRVQLSCRLAPAAFTPPGVKGFAFGRWTEGMIVRHALDLGSVSGTLDEEGGAQLACPPAREGGAIDGPARATIEAAVFEAGSGRATVGRASVMVHPERFAIGLRSRVDRALPGEALPIEGVVVDWAGHPVKDVPSVEVELDRLEDEWGWYYDDDGSSYRHWRRPVREGRQTVPVKDGHFSLTLTPGEAASAYLVRARAGRARADLEVEGRGFYWGYWGAEESVDATPKPSRASWLEIEGPPSLEVGEKATFHLEAPYKGRMLLTVETDEIVRAEWREVEAGPVSFEATLDAFEPNVYVSALLFLDPAIRGSDAPSTRRAFGVHSFAVRPTRHTQALRLEVPREIRSSSTLLVTLDLGPLDAPARATVAAVDEGILSLTQYPSPDPFPAIFPRRALGVSTYETVGWSLLLPPAGPSSGTGGDEEAGDAGPGRVQPVRPVALFSGVIDVPKSGKATVRLEVPEYRGALRVMAVTAGKERIGHADARVVVRDPIVVQATVPRFLTRGDRVRIPVFVSNVSGRTEAVTVTVETRTLPLPGTSTLGEIPPPLRLSGERERTLTLKDGESATLTFDAEVVASAGAVHVTVRARSKAGTFEQNDDVPILPSGPKVRRMQRVELHEGANDLTPYLKGWEPLSERTTFWVTDNPYAPAFEHLAYLLRYPYGCIEQTTSSAWPLLTLSKIAARIDPEKAAAGKVEDMVMAGIDRIFSMQTPSGGFAYWPGGTEPTPWGTAYAVHFLLEAKKARYPVDEARLGDAITWLASTVPIYRKLNPRAAWSAYWGYYDEPYIHYVLALAGKPRKARAQELLSKAFFFEPWWRKGQAWRESASAEARLLLQAAIYLAGDRRYEAQLKHPDLSVFDHDRRSHGWSFYSDRRARALALVVFEDLFGDDPAGEPLAQVVYQRLVGQPSEAYTTQELAWSISGLGRRVLQTATSFGEPVLLAGGKEVPAQPRSAQDRGPDRTFSLYRASELPSLTLNLPAKGEGKVYVVITSEGVRGDAPWEMGGDGLLVSRAFFDASGKALDGKTIETRLGEVVYVKLTLKNRSVERLANLALVDRLPAGFEIENPRLGRSSDLSFLGDPDDRWLADHMNLRDDRIEVFGGLDPGQSVTVVYAVRATAAGSFTVPPVEAEAMYDPAVWARAPGGRLEVAGPWSE